jgi:hypothetical protein
VIENIYARNFDVGEVAQAGITIDDLYEEGEAGRFMPIVRDVEVRNLTTRKAQYALYLRGLRNAPIERVRVIDCNLDGVAKANVVDNVNGLEMRNVRINGRLISRDGM